MEKVVIEEIYDSKDTFDILSEFSDRLVSLQKGKEYIEKMSLKFSEYATVLALYQDDDIAAFSAFYRNDHETKKAFLSMIAVSKKYEGKGYGKKMLNEIEHICIKSGMTELVLEVNKNNFHALRFYENNGFVFLNKETENSLFMKKMLLMEE